MLYPYNILLHSNKNNQLLVHLVTWISQTWWWLLLLLSHFNRVWLCATPEMAAHQAPPSLGFSRQEHWSGLPFPSPMHESEKWKWSHSVMSDSWWPHGPQPTRLLRPGYFQARVLEWGAIASPVAMIKGSYIQNTTFWMIAFSHVRSKNNSFHYNVEYSLEKQIR